MDVLAYLRSPERHLVTRRFAGTSLHAEQLDAPLRIAQISDQHVGLVTPWRLQKAAIDKVNSEQPDLVVLTGDYIAHSLDWLDQLEELVSGIDAPTIAVLGNHDHWSGPRIVQRSLERAGVLVLNNANTVVSLRGQRLQVVGVDDAYTGHADIERATRGMRAEVPTLGLSHVGETADELWARGVPLVLSGHTHSGQIAVANLHRALIGRLAGHRYVHGLYGDREQLRAGGALYVSAGIGSSRFGLRLGERARPEVALFDLGVAPGAEAEHHREHEREQRPLRVPEPEAGLAERRRVEARKKQEKRSRGYAAPGPDEPTPVWPDADRIVVFDGDDLTQGVVGGAGSAAGSSSEGKGWPGAMNRGGGSGGGS